MLTATAGGKAEILYLNASDALRIKAARKLRSKIRIMLCAIHSIKFLRSVTVSGSPKPK